MIFAELLFSTPCSRVVNTAHITYDEWITYVLSPRHLSFELNRAELKDIPIFEVEEVTTFAIQFVHRSNWQMRKIHFNGA